MEKATAVRELVEPALTDRGIEVFDIEFTGGRLLITVNRTGGIDLEALTEANRVISSLLDEHDPIPDGNYLLEVSSPGLERTLRTSDHFTRALGETINVKLNPNAEGERRYQGQLETADDDGITVGGRHFAYSDIETARTVFEWGPTPKRSSQKQAPKKPSKQPSKNQQPTKTTNAKAGS